MDSEKIDLKTAFALFKDEKHIDRPVMMGVLKDVFMTQLTKTFGSADNFDVIINVDKGDCEIYQNLEVVENVENPNTQISLEEVNKNGDDYELGETFTRKVELKDFGRRGILNRSSPAKFTRHGPRRCLSSTRTATSSDCLRTSRFRVSISRRTTPSAPSSRAWR